MAPLLAVVPAIVDFIGKWWMRREETRAVEHQAEIEIKKAEVNSTLRRLETQQQMDSEWEIEQIKQSGWKDEWVTILISIPLVLCFIPGGTIYVTNGFEALKGTPDWYQYAVLAVFAAALGFRKLTDFIQAVRK